MRARRTFATTGERSVAILRHGPVWMGEVARADPRLPLSYRLLGDCGWEEIGLYDADRCLWRRNLHEEQGYSDQRVRLRLGGAQIKDRYRGAYWSAEITVSGADILAFEGFGFDHPEQRVWRKSGTVLGFETVTHGDVDGVTMTVSRLPECRIEVHTAIAGYPKIDDPTRPPSHPDAPEAHLVASGADLLARGHVELELPGVELRLSLERVTDVALPRAVEGEIPLSLLALTTDREHPLFLTARQVDQSRIWTSPLFLSLIDDASRTSE